MAQGWSGNPGFRQDSEALARSLESNEGVHFVPAFVGLGAPHWDPDARGTLVGLTRGSTRAHLARAALEAMAFGTVEVIRAMEDDSGVPAQELRVDGGAATNDWLLEFQADVLGIPVRRHELVETTALGAAGLAGLSVGVWAGAGDFMGALGEASVFVPTMGEEGRREALRGWDRAVAATRAWSDWRRIGDGERETGWAMRGPLDGSPPFRISVVGAGVASPRVPPCGSRGEGSG